MFWVCKKYLDIISNDYDSEDDALRALGSNGNKPLIEYDVYVRTLDNSKKMYKTDLYCCHQSKSLTDKEKRLLDLHTFKCTVNQCEDPLDVQDNSPDTFYNLAKDYQNLSRAELEEKESVFNRANSSDTGVEEE